MHLKKDCFILRCGFLASYICHRSDNWNVSNPIDILDYMLDGISLILSLLKMLS